jgi:hypothetical protein
MLASLQAPSFSLIGAAQIVSGDGAVIRRLCSLGNLQIVGVKAVSPEHGWS